MTEYLLDTDICSYIIKERSPLLQEKFQTMSLDDIGISVVTYAELLYGVERSSSPKINKEVVDLFVGHFVVHNWNKNAALHYASIRHYLTKSGKNIGNMDMLIAAHARSLEATIVTNNNRHFDHVPDLSVENWVSG